MERKRELELVLVEIESDTQGREGPPFFDVYRHACGSSMDQVLARADSYGVFRNGLGHYFGTIERMYYEPLNLEFSHHHRLSLTYNEFKEMGRPKKIRETTTYEPIGENP